MKQLVMAAIALVLFGVAARDGDAQPASQGVPTREALMGKWCTQAGSITFAANLAVITLANGTQKVMNIKRIDVDGQQIIVSWAEDAADAKPENRGKGSSTNYGRFSGNTMVQLSVKTDSGQMTPERTFQRCS